MRVTTPNQLEQKWGIPYCPRQQKRLSKAGKFPKPIQLGPRLQAYLDDEIAEYVEEKRRERDARLAEEAAP
jgi:prophage regulatory protein